MDIKENGDYDGASDYKNAGEATNTANTRERRTEITVTIDILIAMAAHAFTHDGNILCFALRMQFITDIASAAFTGELVDKVRGAR